MHIFYTVYVCVNQCSKHFENGLIYQVYMLHGGSFYRLIVYAETIHFKWHCYLYDIYTTTPSINHAKWNICNRPSKCLRKIINI